MNDYICAFTALTVIIHGKARGNSITEGDFNGFPHVIVRVVNSYIIRYSRENENSRHYSQ